MKKDFRRTIAFECLICHSRYDNCQDAEDCCEHTNELHLSFCNNCGKLIEYEDESSHECNDGDVFKRNQEIMEQNGQTRFI